MEAIMEEDVFTCPETREKIKSSVYKLRLAALSEVYRSKIQQLDAKTRHIIEAIPPLTRNVKVKEFK